MEHFSTFCIPHFLTTKVEETLAMIGRRRANLGLQRTTTTGEAQIAEEQRLVGPCARTE